MVSSRFDSFGAAYQDLVRFVRARGVSAAPRGKAVTELRWPHIWHITHPQRWSLMIPNRRFNIFFALAEVIWMWSGKGGADFITFYNKSIGQFLDKGIPYFHGSYGRRVRMAGYDEAPFRSIPSLRTQPGSNGSIPVAIDQLEHVIRKIQRDPDTRQAVVSLWDPAKDNLVSSADHPCNNMLYFQLRDNALNMTVVRRSNDLILGVPYNMCQFVHLQALMAGALETHVGHYSVMANNLHVYHDLYPDTLELVEEWAHMMGEARVAAIHGADYWGTMAWDLREFDFFVRNVWEPFEKASRLEIQRKADGLMEDLNPYYEIQRIMMESQLQTKAVSPYWCVVFRTLFAYHAAKAQAFEVFHAIVVELPEPIQWQIMDFWASKPIVARMLENPELALVKTMAE